MSQYLAFPAERDLHNIVSLNDERNFDVFDGIDAHAPLRSHSPLGPPPSYEALPSPAVMDEKNHFSEPAASLGDSLAQLPFEDFIAGSSSTRRSLPAPPSQHASAPPSPLDQQTQPSQGVPQQQESPPPTRPHLPHAPRSSPDPRGKARLEHIKELEEIDPFGNRLHDDSPFEAGRRAQRVPDGSPTDAHPSGHIFPNGRMPSVKPGEIMPVNTMRPPNGMPTFYPPFAAPPFPPTTHHAPIRPAHFPPEMHPPAPPQLAREPSHRHTPPPPPPQPTRSYSYQHQLLPPPPQPTRSQSHRHPPPQPAQNSAYGNFPPPPPQPQRSPHDSHPPAPQAVRRHTYDARGVPPGLTPNGRYGTPPPAPQMPISSAPHGHPHAQSYTQPLPPELLPRGMPQPRPQPPQPQYQQPPPGRSILREPQRRSLPASRSPFATPSPTPVRLPSENVPPLSGVVHTPPVPSGSPRPDLTRAPRSTPKPVMPQLLAPLAAQDSNHRAQLQRSASVAPLPSEKGGLLFKTRSILKKRNSSSGIKTHADGAISFASQPGVPMKRYEHQMPALPTLREETGGGGMKLGKRLSKKK